MERLGHLSKKGDVLITDAGSNYYIGGQVWKFTKGQKEITSGSNAAMGLSIPLAIGAAVAEPKSNILAVTGDAISSETALKWGLVDEVSSTEFSGWS